MNDIAINFTESHFIGGGMKLILHEIELNMKNQEKTLEFYSDILGLNVKHKHDGLQVYDSGWAGLYFDNSVHYPNKTSISFLTDDLESYVKHLSNKGINVNDPEDSHLGMKTVSFEDPNGIRIEIQEPTEQSPVWLRKMIR